MCAGWVDSLIRHRYARKFTPRKPESKWSTANRQRHARLKASGRLMPAGLNRAPTDRTSDAPGPLPSRVPRDIQDALRQRPSARSKFESLAPSHRRKYIGWIDSAKQQDEEEAAPRRSEEHTSELQSLAY